LTRVKVNFDISTILHVRILAAETQYRAHAQKQCVMCNINILPLNLKVSL
jgi:hypothetical protein